MDAQQDLAYLKNLEPFQNVPDSQLQWLLEKKEIFNYESGDFIFEKGTKISHMFIVRKGRANMYFLQKNQQKEFGELKEGDITGLLPYSRMTETKAYAKANEEGIILFAVHKDLFPEMIKTNHELVEALVHVLTSRVRDFTQRQFQDEKLMSLGKLSAGLAHELNNPASAVVRGAHELKKHLGYAPDKFKAIMELKLNAEQTDAVNEIVFTKAKAGVNTTLSMMEKTELEDDLTEWLDDFGVENSDEIAEVFVDFELNADDLDEITEIIGAESVPAVANWILNVLTTEKIVSEVEDASQRISDLVKSIKEYSYMDRSHDKQPVCMNKGIRNTLTMLEHKIRKANLTIEEQLEEELPLFQGFPGELNQIWTNLIDNAIDAMKDRPDSTLTLKTLKDDQFVKAYVIDNGPGIPEEIKSQIFDPFFTTKAMGEGTGLGLDIALKIVNQHKGSLKVDSEPGRTAFEVCIPLEQE